MIGKTIEARARVSAIFWCMLIIAVLLGVLAGITQNPHVGLLIVFPVVAMVLFGLRREPNFEAQFTEHSLLILGDHQAIPYDSLRGLVAPKRPGNPDKSGPRHYPIEVIYTEGAVLIPARLDVSSNEVYEFLYSLFPEQGSRRVHNKLQDHLDKELTTFSEDKVFTYCGRKHLTAGGSFSGASTFFLAMLLTGFVWLAVGIVWDEEGWIGGGGACLGLGLFGMLISLLLTKHYTVGGNVKNASESSLVISPRGLALVQGDLQGIMEWDELKDTKFNSQPRPGRDGKPAGHAIRLHFGDIDIWIPDIYDCPPWIIYQHILDYWR